MHEDLEKKSFTAFHISVLKETLQHYFLALKLLELTRPSKHGIVNTFPKVHRLVMNYSQSVNADYHLAFHKSILIQMPDS